MRCGLQRSLLQRLFRLILKEGAWALGELDVEDHQIAETPWAVWIVSPGQLIRLDRKLLADWLGEPPS